MVLPVIAGLALMLPFIWLGGFFWMRWQTKYPTGMVRYPMGAKARDPQANRDAVERVLAAGHRAVTTWWRLWPIFAALLLLGLALTIYNNVT